MAIDNDTRGWIMTALSGLGKRVDGDLVEANIKTSLLSWSQYHLRRLDHKKDSRSAEFPYRKQ
jgi:hypothetical protein